MKETKKVEFYYSNPIEIQIDYKVLNSTKKLPSERVVVDNRTTVCVIIDYDAKVVKYGVTLCSVKDRFVKKTGREISKDRAETKPIMITTGVVDRDMIRYNVSKIMEYNINTSKHKF